MYELLSYTITREDVTQTYTVDDYDSYVTFVNDFIEFVSLGFVKTCEYQ